MIGSTLLYMATVGLGQAASLLLLPLITRYLAPTAYGEYTLVLATTALVGTIGSAWIRNVAMRLHFDFGRDGRAATLFCTAAILQAGPLAALMVAGYLWTQRLGEPVSVATYAAGATSVLVGDAYALTVNTLRAEQRATAFGIAEISSSLLRITGTWIGLVLGYRSPAMLFVFSAFAQGLAGLIVGPPLLRSLSGPRVVDRAAARELVSVGLPSIPLWIGSWLMTLSNRTFLAWFHGLDAVGIFSVAQALGERAITGLALGLSMMSWPAILRIWTDVPAEAPAAIRRFTLVYVAMTLGPAVALVIYRDAVVALLVGAAYRRAATAMPWVVAGAWLIGLAGYLNRPLELRKEYGTLSRMTLTAAAVNVLLNLGLVPGYGIVGTAIGIAGAGLTMVILSAIIVGRLLLPWRSIAGVAAAALAAVLLSWLVRAPLPGIAVFAAVYAPLAYVVCTQGMRETPLDAA